MRREFIVQVIGTLLVVSYLPYGILACRVRYRAINLAKSGRLEMGDNILRTL